jgi:elongation factor Ts
MAITAADVKKLRVATNAGMMDCKKALTEANGDFDEAVKIVRKKGLAFANKRADREATEGCVLAQVNGNKGVMIALNCETDFVAKNDKFIALTQSIIDLALTNMPADKEALLALPFADNTVNEHILEQTGIIGEKLELSFYGKVESESSYAYIHPGNKLATLIGFNKTTDAVTMKDIAMQTAAMAPVAIDKDGISEEVVARELDVAKGKAIEEGKPEAMLEKIAMGRLNKFFQEVTLLNQAFIKENKQTVKQHLASIDKDLTVTDMVRFTLNA